MYATTNFLGIIEGTSPTATMTNTAAAGVLKIAGPAG